MMRSKEVQIDKTAALCGMIWLVLNIDACFTWYLSWPVRYVVGALFVFYSTMLLSQRHGLVSIKQRRFFFIPISILALFMFIGRFQIIYAPFQYGPLLCVILWRYSALLKFYHYFRKFILFYAILSIFIELLVLARAWTSLPCITIFPPYDNVQEQLGYINYFYGLFIIPVQNGVITFYRACGPLREGGHFAVYLGFVYFAEKWIHGKRNFWLLICGFLTLSPNFLFAMIITEVSYAVREKLFLKSIFQFSGILFLVVLTFFLSPQSVKDDVIGVILERSLEQNIENAETDGPMAILNGRTGGRGEQEFNSFLKKDTITHLFGDKISDDNVMSDFRSFIIQYGLLGFIITIWCVFMISFKLEHNLFGAGLFLFAILIFSHRSWMFRQIYIFLILFLVVTAKRIIVTSDLK